MITIRKLLIASLVLGSCGLGFALYGQENGTKMYLELKGKGEGEKEADSIYTGKVIAYGELLSAPYYIEFRNDTVWINNIPVHPPIKIWQDEPVVFAVSDTQRLVNAMVRSIGDDFVHFYNEYGEKEALMMLTDKYANHPLIEKFSFSRMEERGIVTGVWVEFSNGYKIAIGSSKARDADGKIVEIVPSPESLREDMKMRIEAQKSRLRQGYLLIYGMGGSGSRPPGHEQDIYLETLKRIAKGEITIEEAIADHPGLFRRPDSYFWKEFELKKDTWK